MDTAWVYRQYDHQLFLNTVVGPGGDATVLRLKHPTTGEDTGRGMALTTDGNHRWCAIDPRAGTAMIVAESLMNLACVGARPVALVNCLNFGNPEHAEVMWQFSETVDGMTEACRAFGVPVVGGNVSFYNESGGADIDPTPVVGLLGLIDALVRPPVGPTLVEGGRLVLLGSTEAELSGSAWARARGHRSGRLPGLDLEMHSRVAGVVRDLVNGGRGRRRARRVHRRARAGAHRDGRALRRRLPGRPHPRPRRPSSASRRRGWWCASSPTSSRRCSTWPRPPACSPPASGWPPATAAR